MADGSTRQMCIRDRNNAVWELTFAPGRENRVEKTEAAADVTMPINEFSALICGARGAEDKMCIRDREKINRRDIYGTAFFVC